MQERNGKTSWRKEGYVDCYGCLMISPEVTPETNTCIYMYRGQFPAVIAAIAKLCLAVISFSQVFQLHKLLRVHNFAYSFHDPLP